MVIKQRLLRLLLATALVLFCVSCSSVPVAKDLSQRQANEIVAVLNSVGINSIAVRDSSGGRVKYTVEVRKGFYSQAVGILHEKGLPEEDLFTEMIEQKGIIPNSREVEALRLDHAAAIEIEQLLHNHPGVSSARVIVRLNSLKENAPASVSAIIQERAQQNLNRDELTAIISRTVPGIAPENVSVWVSPADTTEMITGKFGVLNQKGKVITVPLVPFLLAWRVPDDDYDEIALALISFLLIMGLVGAIIGYWFASFQKSKLSFHDELPDAMPRALRIDRPGKDMTEG